MALNFGLTNTGFIAPTYEEILDDIEDDFREKFGDDIALTSNSTCGIIARIFAWRESQLIQQLEKIYYSGFISTSLESALDRHGSNIGIGRKIDSVSYADITITTQDEYLIQAGEQFETEDGIEFVLIKDVITEQQKDGTWSGVGRVQSVETGSMNNVKANTITIVSNPDEEILTVTNPDEARGGQDYEDDEAFRNRLKEENASKPGPTANGVRSALMNLPGVREVGIVDNDQGTPDEYGNPPYSVHIYVLGGDDQQIADTLAQTTAIGITLAGSKVYNVIDETGNPREVKFDNSQEKPVYVKVDLSINSNWNNDDGVDTIKQAIADAINELEMGENVVLTKLYPEVYDINGVNEATITLGTTANNYVSGGIKVNKFETPTCDPDNVEVVMNGR